MRTSCEVPKRQRCVSVKVWLTDGRVHRRDAWKCREGFLAILTRVVVVVPCCLAFEWDVCRRLLLNRGFIKINGFRCKRSRRWKTDCACEGQREHLSRRVLSTMVCLFVGLCISEEVWSQRLLVEAAYQIISARLMGCVIPTSLSVCASECEAFCSRIVVCFEGGWLRIGLCGLSFFFCLLWLGLCCATHELYSDCFSQRHWNSMSMRRWQRRGVGFSMRSPVFLMCGRISVSWCGVVWPVCGCLALSTSVYVGSFISACWCVFVISGFVRHFSATECFHLQTFGVDPRKVFGRTVVLCVVCCVSLETFQVFCVCSACAQISRTHGFHV